MTELEMLVLNNIKKKHSFLEIMQICNLTEEQLCHIVLSLKNKGFSISNKYYYDGRLIYEFNKLIDLAKNYNNQIVMGKSDTSFSAILIADTHIGGERESIDMLNRVYDLCAKQGVHIIIHCGDFIDSFVNENANINNFIERQAEQIDRALKVYPFDSTIFNFICLGNHDLQALAKGNQNLAMAFENNRPDLVPIGWNSGTIKVKSDQILVGHKVNKKFPIEAEEKVIILGHKHYLSYELYKGKIIINVPALDNSRRPILKVNLKLDRGLFTSGVVEEFTLGGGYNLGDFAKTNEIRFELENNGEALKRVLKK